MRCDHFNKILSSTSLTCADGIRFNKFESTWAQLLHLNISLRTFVVWPRKITHMFVFNFQPITHTLLRQSRLQLKSGSDGSDKQILETDYAITPDDEQCCENKRF